MPASEQRWMTLPPPAAAIAGTANLLHRNTPLTFTAISASQSSSLVSSTVPLRQMPALLTRMCSAPKRSTAPSTIRRQSAARLTSARRATARSPISAAVSRAAASSTSPTTTLAPSSAKARAIARPLPAPAPVTIATFPFNRNMLSASPCARIVFSALKNAAILSNSWLIVTERPNKRRSAGRSVHQWRGRTLRHRGPRPVLFALRNIRVRRPLRPDGRTRLAAASAEPRLHGRYTDLQSHAGSEGVPRSLLTYHPGLSTDLYHPDAAYVAWRTGHRGLATFDLYSRRAPFGGAYMLTAGLEPALEFLQAFRYAEDDLAFLEQIRDYDPAFLDYLAKLRFSGEVLAMREGTVAFPNEPIVRVTAPYVEALLVESGLLQAINGGTLVATKASRVVWAARGKRVAEFALRRALEPFTVARSSFIGGCTSTSFLAGAFRFRLPATGSIPHALVQLFDTEEEAFRAVAETFSRY